MHYFALFRPDIAPPFKHQHYGPKSTPGCQQKVGDWEGSLLSSDRVAPLPIQAIHNTTGTTLTAMHTTTIRMERTTLRLLIEW